MTTDQTPDRLDDLRAEYANTGMVASDGAVWLVSQVVVLREQVERLRARPAVPSAAAPPTQAVKQRADCTELEWAEQERARFERLYTRETVRADLAEKRADTAARDADIYQQRLERLGEGYTRERKRAERAEAEAERLRTYRDATCICQHTEQQHFEDACLACDCGDYLPPAAAREVIARYQEAAKRETVDRPAVLNAAAQHLYTALFPAVYDDMGQKAAEGVQRAVSELRRLAEAPQPETQAGPLPFIHTDDDGDQLAISAVMASTYDGEAPVVAVNAEQHGGDQQACVYVRPERVEQVVAALRSARQAAEAMPAVVAQPGKEG